MGDDEQDMRCKKEGNTPIDRGVKTRWQKIQPHRTTTAAEGGGRGMKGSEHTEREIENLGSLTASKGHQGQQAQRLQKLNRKKRMKKKTPEREVSTETESENLGRGDRQRKGTSRMPSSEWERGET